MPPFHGQAHRTSVLYDDCDNVFHASTATAPLLLHHLHQQLLRCRRNLDAVTMAGFVEVLIQLQEVYKYNS
jgi:hypothetical protein